MTAVFLRFLNLSITAGWMVLAVLLLRLCLKKAPRWITCVLWGLVALRLILPFTIESPISLIPTPKTVVSTDGSDSATPVVDSGLSAIDKPLNDWLQKPVDAPVEKPSQSPIVQSPLPPGPDTNTNTAPQPTPDVPAVDTDPTPAPPVEEAPVTPEQKPAATETKAVSRMERILRIAAPVWLVGIGLMLLYEIVSVLRVRRRVLDAVRLRDNIWQSDRVASPFILGVFRPRIYIPYGLEEPVLEQVLSHERAHLHRRDHWIKPFAFTLLAVYWYNPLLWVGYILLCRDIEVACDERVVRGLDEDTRRQYANALLQCGVERRSIAACPLAFGEVSIKQRIKSVLNYRKPLLWVIIASLVVCAVAAVCLLTVPKSKPNEDGKSKKTVTEEEDPIVVLSSKEIKPDQVRQFFSQDTDGALVEAGCNWMWEHAENPDQQTPDIEYWEETNVPLVVSHSKADLDALMDACSDDEWDQVDMRYWFELEKYDDAYFEDKVIVWLHVPGYSLGHYDYAVTLEETNKGLRYAVSVEYESTSMFNPWTGRCEYLLLFETDRKLIEEAKTLTTRHEQAPFELPEEDGLTMVPVGNIDLDGDGEKEEIRLYHSELNLDTGWDSGYETAYLVVYKADGTVLLREDTFYYEHSQCYLVTQEDGSSLLLFVEARDLDYAYPDEEFGVLSLKGGERTVVQRRYDGKVYPNNLDVGDVISYVSSLSGWLEDAQLLFGCEKGSLYYGDEIGNTPRYTPLCWLDEYRESADDTLQDILENIIASLNGDIVSIGDIDFNHDGQLDSLFVFGYTYGSLDMYNTCLLVKEADGTILTGFHISTSYSDSGTTVYLYRVTDDQGKERLQEVTRFADGTCHVSDLSMESEEGYRSMTMAEWLDHVEKTGAKLICYMQGMELYFPDEDPSDNYLNEDATKYTVTNYNPSIVAYNAFLKGQRVAHEYGELDTIFYVSDLYATVNDKGIKRYALADVTGDGVPELITEGYSMSVFTYQSGRLLRLYETAAGMERKILSNGYLWEQRLGGGNNYRYTKFFEIGTTHTVEFGDPGYDTDDKKYHVDGVWMNKADFDAKTSTYFANAQSPALLIWYDYTTKQPNSQAMVQYLSLLQNVYQNNSSAYYALHDADGDGTQELLVKMGETIVVGLPQSNLTLSNKNGIEWVSFQDKPVYTADMTFDGFLDVAVFAEDCAYSKSYAVLRWDVDKERLVLIPTVLENPAVDTSISKIRTSRSGDQIVSYSMWDYDEEKKDFVRTHSLYFEKNEQSTSDSDNMKLVVTENGQTKTLYVRGEPYALDKTDPQVAPYYAPNSLWCLYSDRWEYYIFAQDVDELSYNTYALLLQEEYDNQVWLRMTCRDLNGDGQDELLLLEDGTNRLIVYTMKDGYTHLLVNQGFASGTSRFLDTGDADYPGIIYFCVGGGKDRYYYLTLDNVQDGEFVEIPLWTDNYAFYDEGEEGRITELSDDKKLIELSRKAYEQNKDIYFSLFVTEGHEDWVKHAYGSSIKQHNSKPDVYRDLGELQPETNDVVLLDGQQYQSYVASSFDMRYIFVSNKEYDMTAQWDWVPIGTCADYSLDNLGKIDDGQRGSLGDFVTVLDNKQSFASFGETYYLSDLLSQYDDEISRYAVVDMDGDDKPELVLEFDSMNFLLVLKKDSDSYYGHLFSFRSMYYIDTDGHCYWNSSANERGCSRIRFEGDAYEWTDLWRQEDNADHSATYYYVDGKSVSEEYYRSVTSTVKEEVQWYAWR